MRLAGRTDSSAAASRGSHRLIEKAESAGFVTAHFFDDGDCQYCGSWTEPECLKCSAAPDARAFRDQIVESEKRQ